MYSAGLNHFNIATADLELSAEFYESLGIGLKRGHRPQFPTTGIWLYLNDQPIVHLNDMAEVGPIVSGTAAVHHVGFTVHGTVAEVCEHLKSIGVKFDLWDPIPGVYRALYFKGLSGESIEFVLVDNFVPRAISRIELDHIASIADRAILRLGGTTEAWLQYHVDRTAIMTDLELVHRNCCPLQLVHMATDAEIASVMHDVFGIRQHLDRDIGKLGGSFWPRYASRD